MGSPKGFGADRRPRQPVPNLEVSERPRLGAFLRKQKLGFRNDREAPSFALRAARKAERFVRRCGQRANGRLIGVASVARLNLTNLSACSSPRLRRGFARPGT